MRRKILYAAGLLFLSFAFRSCDMGGCQTCQWVEYYNNNRVAEGEPTEYCDTDLAAIKAQDPIINGSSKTQWECW